MMLNFPLTTIHLILTFPLTTIYRYQLLDCYDLSRIHSPNHHLPTAKVYYYYVPLTTIYRYQLLAYDLGRILSPHHHSFDLTFPLTTISLAAAPTARF